MTKRGFTLIEMMIVLAVIGTLVAVIVPRVSGMTMKAKDSKRKADLKAIQLALETFFEDNGYYPQSACGWDCNGYRFSTAGAQWIPELAQYFPGGALPQDPRNNCERPWDSGCFTYSYGNVGRTTHPPSYDLTAHLENPQDPDRCAAKCYRWYFDNQPWCAACGGNYHDQLYELGPLTPS